MLCGWEVTAGLAESNGSLYRRLDDLLRADSLYTVVSTLFIQIYDDMMIYGMIYELRAQRSVSSMGKPLPLSLYFSDVQELMLKVSNS